MKKNVDFISLDSSLTRWLSDQLRTAAPHTPAAQELREALEDLMDGTVGSLMLELGAEQPLVAAGDTICCGTLSIDLRLRRVSRDGTEISLTPKEFDILYFLARNRGEVFTKEQIYQAVWESDYLLDDSNI
ncbi:MAG: winged helix-turn-helix domain-containing protein, partial [Butyricicoccus sp.]|nr:winged helix-turn-helix domain-containing protein [Butyricicoccus sp.]